MNAKEVLRNQVTANQVRTIAARIENGEVEWVWFKAKMKNGMTIMYATDGAPRRPGGFST